MLEPPCTDPQSIPTPQPQGFAIQLVNSAERNALTETIKLVLQKILFAVNLKFEVVDENLNVPTTILEILINQKTSTGKLSPAEAWDCSYILRALPGVLYVEPLVNRSVVQIEGPTSLWSRSADLAESNNSDWSLKQTHIFAAWDLFQQRFPNKVPGDGVVIGHPDTGYLEHPEIRDNILRDRGRDYIDGDLSPLDGTRLTDTSNFDGDYRPSPGHGTSTASVIISPEGAQAKYPNDSGDRAVTGVAPGAKLLPLRIRSSYAFFDTFNPTLAWAIRYAATPTEEGGGGAHVISISMGGPPSWRLREAITYAQEQGVIVLASAGNILPFCTPFVVWPAAYDEVIGVGSSNARGEFALHSSRGQKVDVVAPGESVWCASIQRGPAPDYELMLYDQGNPQYIVERKTGTSLAVALVAGVAALWLSYHVRDDLIKKYGKEKIPFIFNHILRQSCDPGSNWNFQEWGAGIVNAEKVLKTPLPDLNAPTLDPVLIAPPVFNLIGHVRLDRGAYDTLEHLLESILADEKVSNTNQTKLLRFVLIRLLVNAAQLSENEINKLNKELELVLKAFGQELAFHIAFNPEFYDALRDILHETSEHALMFQAVDENATKLYNLVEELRQKFLGNENVSPRLKEQIASSALAITS
jgi:thermitase